MGERGGGCMAAVGRGGGRERAPHPRKVSSRLDSKNLKGQIKKTVILSQGDLNAALLLRSVGSLRHGCCIL